MRTFVVVLTLVALCAAEPVPVPKTGLKCDVKFPRSGLSAKYYENIGHAVHSMTLEILKMFSGKATVKNDIPTVNMNLAADQKVLDFAPSDPVGNDFSTPQMNVVDHVLQGVGVTDDGLGKNWSPVERLVHHFHMIDLWNKIKEVYDSVEVDPEVCACLTNTRTNGVRGSVEWVAHHYATGTPITLLNRAIPKLTDANSWSIWKDRLLHYYTKQALLDAAYFLKCHLQ